MDRKLLILQTLSDYYEKFNSTEIRRKTLKDTKKLADIKMHDLLSSTTKEYWDIFYESLRSYISGYTQNLK